MSADRPAAQQAGDQQTAAGQPSGQRQAGQPAGPEARLADWQLAAPRSANHTQLLGQIYVKGRGTGVIHLGT